MSGDDNEIGEKSDLTRIEDLSEFLHQNDPELDAQLDTSDSSDSPPSLDDLPGLDDLEDSDQEDEDFSSFDSDDTDSFQTEDESEDESFQMESEEPSFDDSEESEDFETEDFQDTFEENLEDDAESEQDIEDFSMDSDDSTDFDSQDQEDEFPSFDSESSEEESVEENDSFETLDEENDFTETEDFNMDSDSSDEDFSQEESSVDEFSASEDQEELEEVEEQTSNDSIPSQEPTPTPVATHIDKSEKFEDVKSFAKNITYGKIGVGGNPAFSVILRNVKFEEDAEDIIIILNEHGLVDQVGEEEIRNSLQGGSLLISQISEFSAIYLTHKFRRFDLDIQMGLSDELHPSKSYERDSVGLVSKSRVHQNKSETTRLENSEIDLDAVILTTTPTLENYKITEYLGIVSEFIVVDQLDLTATSSTSESHERMAKGHLDSIDSDQEEVSIDLELSHNDIYKDLSEKLRPQCIKKKGNAVVGINYQITPLTDGEKYKVSCSGSAVWVTDSN